MPSPIERLYVNGKQPHAMSSNLSMIFDLSFFFSTLICTRDFIIKYWKTILWFLPFGKTSRSGVVATEPELEFWSSLLFWVLLLLELITVVVVPVNWIVVVISRVLDKVTLCVVIAAIFASAVLVPSGGFRYRRSMAASRLKIRSRMIVMPVIKSNSLSVSGSRAGAVHPVHFVVKEAK